MKNHIGIFTNTVICLLFISFFPFLLLGQDQKTTPTVKLNINQLLYECDKGNFEACLKGLRYSLIAYIPQRNFFLEKLSSQKTLDSLSTECKKNNNDEICFVLGRMYLFGANIDKNHDSAMYFFQKSCELGNSFGCNSLGFEYLSGEDIPKDYKKAFVYLKKSCDLGNYLGCNNFGTMFINGQGVEKNLEKAFSIYSNACEMGHSLGCRNIGIAYNFGNGISKDIDKAIHFYQKGCDLGDPNCCHNLAIIYRSGERYNDQNFQKALLLHRKACENERAEDCYAMGIFHEKGSGVNKDYEMSELFISKACMLGLEKACSKMKLF
ncbi:MAG: sel1 repeat family protein [bacterium]|nr:sel1 repeat family protein [bacterium]